MQKVHLKRTKRIHSGHLWVFSNELIESPKKYAPGSLVEVFDAEGLFLGTGYINPATLISVRMLTFDRTEINREFFMARIGRAIRLRERLLPGRNAVRLVYSDADYLPGLIVDRYGDCLVVQLLTYGMENLSVIILELLDEALRPASIVLRNDSRSRSLEGLSLYKDVVKGSMDRLPVIEEDGLQFEVDPLGGQKTGSFLDQAENRRALGKIIKGGSGLDLFCYIGQWALRLSSNGAEVIGVDSSDSAIARAERNARLNGLEQRAIFRKSDVFSFLEEEHGKKYDFIVCDPPAFVKKADRIREAVRAYTGLNEKCLGLINEGGILATSSCSYHLSKEMFEDMLRTAAKRSGRRVTLIESRSQSPDHPVPISMPETEYLKCSFLLVE